LTTTVERPRRLRPVDIGKPRMRGMLHLYGFFVAVVSGIVLCALALARPGVAPIISCGIYSLTVCAMFGVSAAYHRRVWTERGYLVMKRLDHTMIFIFIAGTYTPLSVLLLPSGTATVILAIVWGGGILGAVMKVIWPTAPRWLGAPIYIALGWVAVAVVPGLLDHGGAVVVVLLFVGGAFYSAGAIIYALRKPNPWPAHFGHHEIFHAFTLIAALCHHVAIYFALYA
jgi:hemolysin III